MALPIPLPALSECRTLEDVRTQNALINKMATDLVAEPIVQNGYIMSGQNGATAYINIMSMAKKRMQQIFPVADWRDPLYERLMNEAKYLCAQCIHLKYECRERRQPYDHLTDATKRIQHMVKNVFVRYSEMIKRLESGSND